MDDKPHLREFFKKEKNNHKTHFLNEDFYPYDFEWREKQIKELGYYPKIERYAFGSFKEYVGEKKAIESLDSFLGWVRDDSLEWVGDEGFLEKEL